jgi:apolipoprotein N-acyltransferase
MKAWLRSRFAALLALGDDRLSRRGEAAVLVGAGGLAALGFAPLGWWPLTLLGLAVLAARMQRARGAWQALLVGELWGWGHFSVGNGWIATAFTYQAQMPAWLGWIAVLLLAVYLALFPAAATLGAWWLGRRWRAAPVPTLAALWIVTEWARGWVCTGFPWNPLAATALGGFDRPGLARALPWLGTYALSGLVVLLAGQWLFALRAGAQRRWGLAATHLALPAVLFLLPLGGQNAVGTVPFTLVQPDIGQDEINDATRYEAQFQRLAALSLPRQPGQRRLVLWPESAVPDYLQPGYPRAWYAGTTYGGDPAGARAHGPGDRAGRAAADRGCRHDVPARCRAGDHAGRRLERGHRARQPGHDPRQLCQGASRALWRIPADARPAHAAGPVASGGRRFRLLVRAGATHAGFFGAGPAARGRADLL